MRTILRGSIKLLVAHASVLLLVACGRDRDQQQHLPVVQSPEAGRSLDAAGLTCPREVECNAQAQYPDCLYNCVTNRCSFLARVGHAGESPCYGNSGATFAYVRRHDESEPVVACDLDRGSFCDLSTHRCTAVKPFDASCDLDEECGVGNRCLHGKCTVRAAIGSSCAESHCVFQAFCNSQRRCQARLADGRECLESGDCKSFHCVKNVCSAQASSEDTCPPPR